MIYPKSFVLFSWFGQGTSATELSPSSQTEFVGNLQNNGKQPAKQEELYNCCTATRCPQDSDTAIIDNNFYTL